MSELQVSPQQAAAAGRVAGFIRRHGMVAPAVLYLESMRPLAHVGSQFMHILSPAVTTILSSSDWDALAHLLQDPKGLDYMLTRIEADDAEIAHG